MAQTDAPLSASFQKISPMKTPILIFAPEGSFLLPYIRREIPVKNDITESFEDKPALAVMISSTDIYAPDEGWLNEEAMVRHDSPWVKLEQEFTGKAQAADIPAYILRCAPVIGTGMTGSMRRLAESIYRGVFFHFPGNEARKSVVHATDVSKAVKFIADNDIAAGVYNLTDSVDPTLHDIAEALAYRMANKRISNLSTKPQQWFGRMIYGKERYAAYTTSELFSSSRIQAAGFVPTDTCNYMRTHIYDESSL